MDEKKSLDEIILNNLEGKWCDGLAIIEVSEHYIRVDNIYDNNGKRIPINTYSLAMKEKVFLEVEEMNYEDAIREFNLNNRSIISPKIIDEMLTLDGRKFIEYGGNVLCHSESNKIIVNDKDSFDDFNEILNWKLITEKEMKGKWLVF